jgi:hypothetical protein
MATVVNTSSSSGGKQITVGAALSATELCVVRRAGSGAAAGVWRLPLQPLNGDGGGWPALTAALRELSRVLGVSSGRLEVALMPPLTEIRRLDLPPMGESELRMLLSRNAARYFVGARAAQLVGTSMAPQRSSGPSGGVMAAAAPQRLVLAMHAAAREAGWTIDSVSPAEGAWCAAASALWPATARHASALLVCAEDRTELLQLDQGRLSGVRRFRGGAADAALVADAITASDDSPNGRGTARVAAVGVSAQRNDLTRALAAAGLAVTHAPAEWAERANHADAIAAEFAGPNAAPLLRSDATLASRREQIRRMVTRMTAAAAVLLLLSGLLALWGAKRQLRAVQADRAAIKPLLSATLVGRTSVETAFRQLAALAAAQRGAPRWSGVIGELGVRLDSHAYLTSLRARDDSVVVEGIAVSAARAFDSMVLTPGLTNVRAAAPVRRESPQGGPAQERFSIAAEVARPGAPPAKPVTSAAKTPAPATAAQKVSP